ncbi:MAG TPA: TMEM165/GDT1 family protein [Pseudobdellovibrionaceae bacterium]|nr:TMEM165/GDT1 family protein [Pseudobdellovibrionaceae bacterium]
MDWKLFIGTFLTVFLAEMGDKTQLAALAISSQNKSTGPILFAVILALALAGGIGVLAGKYLSTLINPEWIRYGSGVLFLVIGVWILVFGKIQPIP